MKHAFVIIGVASLIGLFSAVLPAKAATKVFLLGGQSNMDGRGVVSELTPPYNTPQTEVKYWNNGAWVNLQGGLWPNTSDRFGPEVSFGYTIHNAFPDDDVYLVKYALGSTALADPAEQWTPKGSGATYNTFKSTVSAALQDLTDDGLSPTIAGMLWMQGESDALTHTYATAYAANLTNFIGAVRSDFAAPDMPFVIGRITTHFGTEADNALVRSAQETVAGQVSNTTWIDTDDLSWAYAGHYGTEGQIELGKRFAGQVPEPSTLALLASGLIGTLALAWRKMRLPRSVRRRMFAIGCLALLLSLASTAIARSAESLRILEQTDVFVSGTEGYNTFRIPATVVTNSGTVLAFCEGRKNDASDGGDIDLLLKRSTDQGKTWSNLQVVHEEGGNAGIWIGNPCPVVDRATGAIWLYCVRSFSKVLLTKSTNDGVTWSTPVEMTQTLGLDDSAGSYELTGPGHGIQLQKGPHAGRLVIPTYGMLQTGGTPSWHYGPSFMIYSDDHGANWQVGGRTAVPDDWPATNTPAEIWEGGECQVVETANGDLYMTARYHGIYGNHPNNEFTKAFAWSRDGGATWEPLGLTDQLREPECQASILRFTNEDDHDKNRILFANPPNYRDGLSQQDARTNLTVRTSFDECITWSDGLLLHAGPSAYSDMAVLPDMTVGVLYERGQTTPYEKITFARLKCDALQVPEPSTLALIATGLLGPLVCAWWNHK